MKRLVLIGILSLLLPLNVGCVEQEANEQEVAKKVVLEEKEFEAAPDFTLGTIDGEELALSEFKGKVIILNFFATWCPPCRRKIPGFIELYNRYRDQGLEIIGVSVDRDKGALISFVRNQKINYSIVLAGKSKITEDYGGIRGIPTTFIIDQELKIRSKHIGYRPMGVFEEEIKGLLPSLPR